jgi:hypothetical protein
MSNKTRHIIAKMAQNGAMLWKSKQCEQICDMNEIFQGIKQTALTFFHLARRERAEGDRPFGQEEAAARRRRCLDKAKSAGVLCFFDARVPEQEGLPFLIRRWGSRSDGENSFFSPSSFFYTRLATPKSSVTAD